MTMRVFTPTSLNQELERLITGHYPMVLVEGELQQLQRPPSGHVYFTLRDADSSMSGVIWSSTWKQIKVPPKEGSKVVVRGRVGVYAAYGRLQLVALEVRPAGEGALAQKLAERKARLEAEGLLDPRRKRPLPKNPKVVGVVTSPTGAALQDFLKVSGERWPAARVLVGPATVQGDEAPMSVIRAIELLLEDGRAEVIVVTRGGGSKQDLMAFQDEQLARYIAHCPIPVVSAVGHQIDTTLCDLVADAIAPTPSAGAMMVFPDGAELLRRLRSEEARLDTGIQRVLGRKRERAAQLAGRLRHPTERLARIRRRCVELEGILDKALARRLVAHRHRLQAGERALAALSPLSVLSRGYAIVTGPSGIVTRSGELSEGDELSVRVGTGRFGARVTVVE